MQIENEYVKDRWCNLLYVFLLFTIVLNAAIGVRGTIVGDLIKYAILGVMLLHYYRNFFKRDFLTKFLLLYVMFAVFQIIYFGGFAVVKLLLGVGTFCVFANISNFTQVHTLVKSIKVAAILMSLNAIYVLFVYGNSVLYFSFREFTWLDKSFYTSIYAFTYSFCILDILYKRKVAYNIALLLFTVAVNLYLVQSKTALFAIAFSVAIMIIWGGKQLIEQNIKLIRYGILAGCLFVLLFPSVVLPDEIKLGVNTLLGTQVFNVDVVGNMNKTYDMRGLIWDFCLGLWFDHPITGIGIGNYGNYIVHADALIADVGEEESSFLQILVEGGLIYFSIMLYYFGYLVKKGIQHVKVNKSHDSFYPILLFVNFCVIIIGNDFIDLFFWISNGIMLGYIYNNSVNE